MDRLKMSYTDEPENKGSVWKFLLTLLYFLTLLAFLIFA